ncbi:MAG: monovalent cation/H+ antiporter complex subunit F [Candidatus Limivicinus sp.]|jgi:multisubunit Na+/H+ antiporter MnhF subunit
MIELIIFGILFAILALCCLVRLKKGPTPADRMVCADSIDILLCCAMVMFALYSGRGIFLDIALIGALMGIVDTMLIGRHLEGRQ